MAKSVIVLVGPAGAGKTTLARRCVAAAPDRRALSVSHTTRAPRAQEVDGRDYHFVTRAEFFARLASGEFVEWAEVHGNLYGTHVLAARPGSADGLQVFFDVDVVGANSLLALHGDTCLLVFVTPPDWPTLRSRLLGRNSEDDASYRQRLRNAREEMAVVLEQHRGGTPWRFLCNDDEPAALRRLEALVSEESRGEPAARVEHMLMSALDDLSLEP